jgi:hypothetical protein
MFPRRVHLFYMLFIATGTGAGRADDPAVDTVLRNWDRAVAPIRRFECRFKRFEYQPASRIERRSHGRITVVSPHHAAIVIDEPEARTETTSRKKDAQGNPYAVEQEAPMKLIWNDGGLTHIDPRAGTFRRYRAADDPAASRFPLADIILSGGKPSDLRDRFHITLLNQTATEVWMSLRPKSPDPARAEPYARMKLILDAATFLPKAVQLQADSPSRETIVFTFTDCRVNPAPRPGGEDLLSVNLKDYREE